MSKEREFGMFIGVFLTILVFSLSMWCFHGTIKPADKTPTKHHWVIRQGNQLWMIDREPYMCAGWVGFKEPGSGNEITLMGTSSVVDVDDSKVPVKE